MTNWLNLYTLCALAALIILIIFILLRILKIAKNREKPGDINWLKAPKRIITLEQNINIAYRQMGKGKDILLIHGVGANTFCWRLIFGELAKHFRVTCFDLPGFGYSTKDPKLSYGLDPQCLRVAQFTDQLKLQKPILIGSSMGGTIALWLALKYPETFEKVVAISPATGISLIPRVFRKIRSVSYYLNWGLNRKTMIVILKQVLSRKSLVNEYTIEGYLNPYIENKTDSLHCFLSSKDLIMDNRLPHALSNLEIKPLILTSRKDKMVRKKNTKELLNVLPEHEFALHNTGGHHLMEDEPKWVLDKINNYISSTSVD